jgi:hypothetical protein
MKMTYGNVCRMHARWFEETLVCTNESVKSCVRRARACVENGGATFEHLVQRNIPVLILGNKGIRWKSFLAIILENETFLTLCSQEHFSYFCSRNTHTHTHTKFVNILLTHLYNTCFNKYAHTLRNNWWKVLACLTLYIN